ncbi:MAG: CotH kinase family protein, partial [Planctomycetota bacterium]|nr:CotH kinase family protein [Planctomycetota bacterium]
MGRSSCRRDRCVPLFEPLEPRLLLAGSLVLTEFLAVNTHTGPADKDGAYSPWIEIRNTSGSSINLKNYYLTKNPDSLTTDPTNPARLEKWRFTSDFIINAGASRIVYATEKSTMTSTEAHTNFRLDVGDGYLALVQSDGVTVVSAFSDYPAQRQDCSYGRAAAASVTLVASEAGARAWVPTNAAVEQAWYDPSFDDSSWAAGATGVGFEYGSGYASLINLNVGPEMYNQNGSVTIRIPFTVTEPEGFSALTLRMKYDDGFVAYLNGVPVASRNAPTLLSWDSGATASHSDTQAKIFEDINIASCLSALRRGDNLLAIQGMNYTVSSNDLLFIPELVAATADGWSSQFYAAPTPAVTNGAAIPARYVADTTFSVDRGFFTDPFSLVIASGTPGAEIRYTLDGSLPTSTTGLVYADPLPISRTTTVRAAAFKSELIPANVDTQTYIFPADIWQPDVLDQAAPAGYPATWSGLTADYDMDPEIVNSPTYQDRMLAAMTALPVMSIVLPLDDMFGASAGLYTHPTSTGVAWEKAVSAELIYSDGTEGFQVDAGIEIQGGGSRTPQNNPKHAFRIIFAKKYGAAELRYPVFGDSAAGAFDSLVLRTEYNNGWEHWDPAQRVRGTLMRDEFARELQLAMDEPASHGTYVNVYINGMYWGVYCLAERPDDQFAAEYLGGDAADYDAIHASAPGTLNVLAGDLVAWNAMMNLATTGHVESGYAYDPNALVSDANYQAIQQYLDVTNLPDYMILMFYTANWDWPTQNWSAVRKREPGAGFKFFAWDSERIMEGVADNRTDAGKPPSPFAVENSPARLFYMLRANAEFRLLFADRVQKWFFNGGPLSPDSAEATWMALKGQLDQAIVAESARWGDYRRDVHQYSSGPYLFYTPDDQWVTENNRLTNDVDGYFKNRSSQMIRIVNNVPQGQFVTPKPSGSLALYPSTVAPTFNQHGGEVPQGFSLTITAPAGDIWYTTDGTDPRLPGGGVNTDHAVLYTGPVTL